MSADLDDVTEPTELDDDASLETPDALDATEPVADDAESLPDDEAAPIEAAGEPPEPVAPAPEPVPFSVRYRNREQPIDGVRFDPATKSLSFTDDASFDRVQKLLANGVEWTTEGRTKYNHLQNQLKQKDHEVHAELEQAKVYLDQWNQMMTMPEDQLAQMLIEARTQWPLLQAKAERAYAERLMTQAQQAQQPPEMDTDTVVEHAQSEIASHIAAVTKGLPWASAEAQRELTEAMQDVNVLNQIVGRARQDDPENGVRKGQWMIDWDRANALLQRFATPYERTASRESEAAKRVQGTQQVAERNAKALALAKPAAKPVAKRPAPNPSDRPMTTQEIRAKIDRDMKRKWDDMQRAG